MAPEGEGLWRGSWDEHGGRWGQVSATRDMRGGVPQRAGETLLVAGAGEAVLSCEPGRGGFRGGAEQGLGGKALELPGAIWPDLDRWLVGTGQWVASSHGGR